MNRNNFFVKKAVSAFYLHKFLLYSLYFLTLLFSTIMKSGPMSILWTQKVEHFLSA